VILYSIIPPEIVFMETPEYRFQVMDYMGEKVEVMRTQGNQLVINRIIGTSLKSYLNPSLQPGTVIRGEMSGKEDF